MKLHSISKIKLVIVLKNYDGGTGTFVRLWKQHYKTHPSKLIGSMRVLSLQKPRLLASEGIVDDYFSDLKYDQRYHFFQSIFRFCREFLWLQSAIKKYHPDIVLSVDSHAIILVELLRIWCRNQFCSVHTIHNNLEKVFTYRLSQRYTQDLIKDLLGYLLNRSTQVICVSKELSVHVKQYLKLHHVPSAIFYGVKPHHKKNSSSHRPISTILSIGRFDDQKDFETLLYALARVHKTNSGCRLILVGDGPKREQLHKLIMHLKLTKHVSLVGWQHDITQYLTNADLFVHSSNWDGLPNVILEAMAYGLPIIASDCDFGPREILRNGQDGILFPVGDVNSLVNCIEAISRTLDYYRNRSLQRAAFFSINRQVHAYEQAFLLRHAGKCP